MENYPNCEKLKETLNGFGIEYEEQIIETKEVIIDLRCLGCFPQESPVLRFMNIFLNDMKDKQYPFIQITYFKKYIAE